MHRDLKPENMIVTEGEIVKILDFGLAKLVPVQGQGASEFPSADVATEAGVIMGTVGYMSPEQARGVAVDHRSDQFAFGLTLYEMATGRRAFRRETAAQTLTAIMEDELEPVSKLTGAVAPSSSNRQPHILLSPLLPLVFLRDDASSEHWLKEGERRFPDSARIQMLLAALDFFRGNETALARKRDPSPK